MHFPQDEQIRDAEITEGLVQQEYEQYANLAEHENNVLAIDLANEESRRLSDIAKDLLQDFHCCTRDWTAWQHGTMSEDDFTTCFDDEDIVHDTFSSIIKIENEAKKAEAEKVEKLQKALVLIIEKTTGCMDRGYFMSDLGIDYIKDAFATLNETGYKTPRLLSGHDMPF
jgi:hypothetical protein